MNMKRNGVTFNPNTGEFEGILSTPVRVDGFFPIGVSLQQGKRFRENVRAIATFRDAQYWADSTEQLNKIFRMSYSEIYWDEL